MSNMDDAFPKTPDAVREEKIIELLTQLNTNLAIMGKAVLNLAEVLTEPEPIKKGKKK